MTDLGKLAKRIGAKEKITNTFGPDVYLALRRYGKKVDSRLKTSKNRHTQNSVNKAEDAKQKKHVKSHGLRWNEILPTTPNQAYFHNFRIIANILDEAQIQWWHVKGLHTGRFVVGVADDSREKVLDALEAFAQSTDKPMYVMDAQGKNPQIVMSRISATDILSGVAVLRFVAPRRSNTDGRKYGFAYGVDIEFWSLPADDDPQSQVIAPRENAAASLMTNQEFELVESEVEGIKNLMPRIFQKSFIDDVDFEIDAVYTWVDGEDEKWQEARLRLQSELTGETFHPEAVHAARFRSRDELKYSLRSLEYFAPWFRKIFIVTADQTPTWLDTSNPKIEIVSHRDIFEPNDIPTFNSNAIISRLHHISDLSEHFVYINDDVILGMPVTKDQFFTGSGIALVSPSNNRRPFGNASVIDGPHFNLTKNIRALLEKDLGKTVSRAIKHTPHPLLKSVLFEMESKYSAAFKSTWQSRFRHHEDIVSDQMHHYYALITGRAVPGNLTYNYINILDDRYRGVLNETLTTKNRHAFCINDAPVENTTPIDDETIEYFFETYFPVKSEFEK